VSAQGSHSALPPAPFSIQCPVSTEGVSLCALQVSAMHLPTMPNTNKALIELLCGLTPRIETSWDELDVRELT
jgi:hypothetical protein